MDENATSGVTSSEAALRSRHQREMAALLQQIEEVSDELEKALGERRAANENLNELSLKKRSDFTKARGAASPSGRVANGATCRLRQ